MLHLNLDFELSLLHKLKLGEIPLFSHLTFLNSVNITGVDFASFFNAFVKILLVNFVELFKGLNQILQVELLFKLVSFVA